MVRWLVSGFLMAAVACNQTEEIDSSSSEEAFFDMVDSAVFIQQLHDTSQYLSMQVFQALSSTLMAQIKANGTAAAVTFCNAKALPITDSVAQQHGIKVQRLASRYRNVANAANTEEKSMLASWEKALTAGQPAKAQWQERESHMVWYGAIVLNQPACLKCHGNAAEGEIDAATLASIQSRYPNDQAQNFKLGELRGMWKISYPKAFFMP